MKMTMDMQNSLSDNDETIGEIEEDCDISQIGHIPVVVPEDVTDSSSNSGHLSQYIGQITAQSSSTATTSNQEPKHEVHVMKLPQFVSNQETVSDKDPYHGMHVIKIPQFSTDLMHVHKQELNVECQNPEQFSTDISYTSQQQQDVADFCSTSGLDNGGVNVATTTIDGQQVIIVTDNTDCTIPGLPEQTITDDVINNSQDEPPAKQMKLSPDDMQPTYVLSLQNLQNGSLQTDEKNDVEEDIEKNLISVNKLDSSQIQDARHGPSSQFDLHADVCVMEQGDENPANVTVSQAWFTTRDDKTALQKKGHSWKMGQWSKDEVDLLHANIHKYCQDNSITSPHEVIFEMSKDERKDFYRTVARGLNRPLFSVYRRVIRMYDQKNYVGKYTPAELDKLRELRQRHGSDWATIGSFLGRSASSVKDRCRLMKETCNAGKWLPSEEQRLTESVYELCDGQKGESIVHGLSWAAVAERVGTRTEKQCRTKWLNFLNWKQRGGVEWTREDDMHLINRIADCEVTDETHLDWVALADGWPSARSPQWLRGKWWSLKRHVPQYSSLPFQELVTNVQQLYNQNIRNKGLAVSSPAATTTLGMQPISFLPLAIPVAVPGGQTDGADGEQLQIQLSAGNGITYEVLQGQGTFFITQPQSGGLTLQSTAGLTGDQQVIVQGLPLCQGEGDNTIPVSMTNIDGQQVILTAHMEGDAATLTSASLTDTEGDLGEPEHIKAAAELCGLANVALHGTSIEDSTAQELHAFSPQDLTDDDKIVSEETQKDSDLEGVGGITTHRVMLHNDPSGQSLSLNIQQADVVNAQTLTIDGHSATHAADISGVNQASIEVINDERVGMIKMEAGPIANSVSLDIDQNIVLDGNSLAVETVHVEGVTDELDLSSEEHHNTGQISFVHLSSTTATSNHLHPLQVENCDSNSGL